MPNPTRLSARLRATICPSALLLAALFGVHPAAAQSTGSAALRVVGPTKSPGGHPELILELGPFDLPAHAIHDRAPQPPPSAVGLQVAGWLQGYAAEIVDAKGGRLPQQLLHHVNVITPGRRELFSPIMQRVAAAGAETGPVRLPRLVGYPVRRATCSS